MDNEPVSRRDRPPRPALSRTAIVEAALEVADTEGLDAVTMRRVAAHLDTGASALYVSIRSRDDLLEAMFDHAMAGLAAASFPARERTWRQRLTWLLLEAVAAAGGRGGVARGGADQGTCGPPHPAGPAPPHRGPHGPAPGTGALGDRRDPQRTRHHAGRPDPVTRRRPAGDN